MQKFGEVGTLDRGISKHRPRNAPELLGGSHPLVQTGEVANCDGYIRSYTSTYSDLGLRQSKMWPAGTLCITIAANIAKTGILTFEACFPDSVVGFRADDPATVEYVRVWLSFLQKALEDSAPESAQKNINLAILRGLNIPLPPSPSNKLSPPASRPSKPSKPPTAAPWPRSMRCLPRCSSGRLRGLCKVCSSAFFSKPPVAVRKESP